MTDRSAQGPEGLLSDLRDAVEERGAMPTLDGAAYMRSHAVFEGASDQQKRILQSLVKLLLGDESGELRVASIGAGSGILDIPLLQAVVGRKVIAYDVVEPFEEQCEAFASRAKEVFGLASAGFGDGDSRSSGAPNPDLTIHHATLDSLPAGLRFGHVLAIHSAYYFPKLVPALAKLAGLCEPGGRITLAIAPREAMNDLAQVFWQPQQVGPVWFEHDVLAALEELGLRYSKRRIDAELVFNDGGRDALDVASFLVQCPLPELGEAERELVFAYLRSVGTVAGGRVSVPHPVSMVSVAIPA